MNLFALSDDVRNAAKAVREAKEKYPSLRVVGRGTVVVSIDDVEPSRLEEPNLKTAEPTAE